MEIRALTVKQLNLYVKSLLDGDMHLQSVTVTGELSNFKNHYSSGHFYFTLKDNDAAIRCVMFRTFASLVRFEPEDGMQVVLRGRVSLYEKDGQYQFYAEEMLSAGLGDIALKFEQVKKRLSDEGLFSTETKRPLPKFPASIAVMTSDTGAAVKDILNILARRWPNARIIICPVSVQGDLAVPEMLDALDRLYNSQAADIIIIGRGGGSAEDLSAFNSEELARKIYESPVPVISAVGHETDFSISDFVADLRAPTPSAAAELAVPDQNDIKRIIILYENRMKSALNSKYEYDKARLERVISSHFLKKPEDSIVNSRSELTDRLEDRMNTAYKTLLSSCETRFLTAVAKLDTLSPLKVLSRGYSITEKSGRIQNSVKDIEIGDTVRVRLSDGCISCDVTEKENGFEN